MSYLDELVFDVRGLGGAVVVCRQRGGADQHVAHADLAAAVTLTVITGETLNQHARKGGLPVHEDVFLGHEDILEHHERFVAAEIVIADVDLGALKLAGIARLAAIDVDEPSASVGTARETA